MRCAESLRVQAYFDAQLDPIAGDEIERHVEHCAQCRALLQDLRQLRARMHENLPYEHAPPALRSRIDAALEHGGKFPLPRQRPVLGRPFWRGALSGFAATAAAALLGFFFLPARPDAITDDLVNAHVRSLMPDHLIDVASTDRHTVKPWFAGHADVSPAVADFEALGYELVGGRADYFAGQRAAVVVYRHGAHTINVFTWATDRAPAAQSVIRNGYHLEFWKRGNLESCAVSDAGRDEVRGLVKLLEALE